MTLRHIESFDHCGVNDFGAKYTVYVNQFGGSTLITGRFGSALQMAHGLSHASRTFDAQATWICGAAVRSTAWSNTSIRIFALYDATTLHVDLRTNGSNQLVATRNGTVLGTSTTALSNDTWYFVEMKATIHDTTGSVIVKINGVEEINFSGDTRNAANASANIVRIGSGTLNATTNVAFDDYYVCDSIDQSIAESGSPVNNDFLGDIRVQAILPSGNGNSSQLVGSDGNSVDNYLLVDEAVPDTADFVESSTVGNKDTYLYGDLTPTTGTVYGIQVLPHAAKTDAGTRSIVSIARLSGVEADSAAKALSTTYQYLPDIRGIKPGGGAWAIADVNAAEFGVKVNA